MNAFGYIRVSTTEQAKSGLSLEYQESQIRLYCQLREWKLVTVFTDERSGRDTNRPAFREMYARMLVGEAKVVVFVRFNRLFRNFSAANQMWNDFQGAGLEFASIREQLDTSTPMGRAMMRMIWVWDELERENISERTQEIAAHLKASGLKYSPVPYGYRELPTGGTRHDRPLFRLEPDPAEQAVIIQILGLRNMDGWGYRRIANLLNTTGVPTKKGKSATSAGVWYPSTVRDILNRSLSDSSLNAGRPNSQSSASP